MTLTIPVTPDLPFLFGAQYYRAPTPSPYCWESDLSRMRALGFNAVKFWVQWRWSHRSANPDRFFWEDLDRLMDLAAKNELGVTLNTIFDVAPLWLYEQHPDARQVDATGAIIQPYVVGHRQIGGHPGPCYNHPEARAHRERLLAAAVERFAAHPAMSMWDVWNEPEQAFHARPEDSCLLLPELPLRLSRMA
jgi:beta-galactosidase